MSDTDMRVEMISVDRIDRPSNPVEHSTARGRSRMMHRDELVIHALIELGGVASGQQIADKLGWSGGSRRVGQIMRFLLPSGRVKRVGDRGVYKIQSDIRQRPK
jgi:alkylated DNA nucleotide flippase Atl1